MIHDDNMSMQDDLLKQELIQRQAERAALQQRIITMLENDSRVRAVWLFGSGARHDMDAFSDLDVWIVVDDAHIVEFVQNRHIIAHRLAPPLLTLDVPANAPVDGAYLMLQYQSPSGPLQVDWYWQPLSNATIPDDAQLLFDIVELPRTDGMNATDFSYQTQGVKPPEHYNLLNSDQQIVYQLTNFWCMSLIAAKDIARQDAIATGWMLQFMQQLLGAAYSLLPDEVKEPFIGVAIDPESLMLDASSILLRQMHTKANRLLSIYPELATHFPSNLVTQVEQLYKLAIEASQADELGQLVRRKGSIGC